MVVDAVVPCRTSWCCAPRLAHALARLHAPLYPHPPSAPRAHTHTQRRDWHYTYDRGLPNRFNVQVEPWTGYTPYPYQFPELEHFMGYLKRRGVAVTFNMHPAAGVQVRAQAECGGAGRLLRMRAQGQSVAACGCLWICVSRRPRTRRLA